MTTSSSPVELVSFSSKIMVGTIIFIFCIMVFIFFLYLYTKWYTSRHENPAIVSWRRHTARHHRSATTTATTAGRGLDPSALQSLPVMEYNSKDFKEGLECSVCLSEVLQGDKIRVLYKCNHMFHVECIDMWFYSHSSCPLCRSPVVCSNDQQQSCSSRRNNNDDDNNDVESQQSGGVNGRTSDDYQMHMHEAQLETSTLPPNALFLGNEAQFSSLGAQPKEGCENKVTNTTSSSSSSSNNIGVGRQRDGLVIEIPSELCEDCHLSQLSSARFNEDEPRSPATTTLRSLKRLLSRGKRVAQSPHGSSSNDV